MIKTTRTIVQMTLLLVGALLLGNVTEAWAKTTVLITSRHRNIAQVWREHGIEVQERKAEDWPENPADLASLTQVVLVHAGELPDKQQRAVAMWVQAGGGLLLEADTRWDTQSGSWLESVSAAVAFDGRSVPLGNIHADSQGPLAGLDLSSFGRIRQMPAVASPRAIPESLLNMLSPWCISKPIWNDDWQVWARGPAPEQLPVIIGGRYGAGHNVVMAMPVSSLMKLPADDRKAITTRLLDFLLPRTPLVVKATPTVAMTGYKAPGFWADDLARGLRGMGQKITLDDLIHLPESLRDAGYVDDDLDKAQAVIMWGDESSKPAPSQVQTVLRLPAGSDRLQSVRTYVDVSKFQVVGQTQTVTTASGQTVNLPNEQPKADGQYPIVPQVQTCAGVHWPTQWAMRKTADTDSTIGLDEKWYARDFDDSQWDKQKLGKLQQRLFGKTLGYDGAVWYRGKIRIDESAITPQSVIQLQSQAHHMEVFVDGKSVATEPNRMVLPVMQLGAGEHVLAVRVYAENFDNRGLIRAEALNLPYLYRADPEHVGFAQQWMNPDISLRDWVASSNNLNQTPQANDSKEGWIRCDLNVPVSSAPFVVNLYIRVDTSSVLFVNGKRFDQRQPHRESQYTIDSSHLHAGPNVLVLWVHGGSHASFNINVKAMQTTQWQATVDSPADGAHLLVNLAYPGGGWPPYDVQQASLLINGQSYGGVNHHHYDQPMLFAAHALKAGPNQVTIVSSRDAQRPCRIKSIQVLDANGSDNVPLTGWRQRRVDSWHTFNWQTATSDNQDWKPVGYARYQDRDEAWKVFPAPDLRDENSVYRAVLHLNSLQLQRNQTLLIRSASVDQIFVNGNQVMADEQFYYSLNAHLHAGDNVIMFRPQRQSLLGLNILTPPGIAREVPTPILVHDRAPLIPVDPSLTAYRINRVFKVTECQALVGSDILMRWPNGKPAVVRYASQSKQQILAAPGIFDDVLPAPDMAVRAKQSGSAQTIEYDYASRVSRDLFDMQRVELLLPALLDAAASRGGHITDITVTNHQANVTIVSEKPVTFAWRVLDFQGQFLTDGSIRLPVANGQVVGQIDLPDLQDEQLYPSGSRTGRLVHLRLALLSEDRTQVFAMIEKPVDPQGDAALSVHTQEKLTRLNGRTHTIATRLLHKSIDELAESFVYLPDEEVALTSYLVNRTDKPVNWTLHWQAIGALDQNVLTHQHDFAIEPLVSTTAHWQIPSSATHYEQPWQIKTWVTKHNSDEPLTHARRSIVITTPRGEIHDYEQALHQGRSSGGYMWQMANHTYALEHGSGTDAMPVPEGGQWWTRVRQAGDGNWLMAQSIHYHSQQGLIWGAYDLQSRGEVMDSYGWFPNGRLIRDWWAPYAIREPLRRHGRRGVVFAMSDWWQYDAGALVESYATMQAFNRWLTQHQGKTIAGMRITGPIQASTLGQMLKQVKANLQPVLDYFIAEQLAYLASDTNRRLNVNNPGTFQSGQAGFAHRLPRVIGGVALAKHWTQGERIDTVDADNHPMAGSWQYALETAICRSLSPTGFMDNGWERPQRYHSIDWEPAERLPLNSAGWLSRQLDSRWQVVADPEGQFKRVLNLTHRQSLGNPHLGLLKRYSSNIGSGTLPDHWRINDHLSALSMTIDNQQPLAPLLVVGESDEDFRDYFGMLGLMRDAGLQFGGAVNLAQLRSLDASRIPALVWLPSTTVDEQLLKAVEEKLKQGVPMLLVGHVPTAGDNRTGLKQMLGLKRVETGYVRTNNQSYTPQPRALKLDYDPSDVPHGYLLTRPQYQFTQGLLKPVVTRDDHVMLGYVDEPDLKLVYLGLVLPRYLRDDPQVFKHAVDLLGDLYQPKVKLDDSCNGYAFVGSDQRTYVVIQNLKGRVHQALVTLHPPHQGATPRAATLLDGQPLTASSKQPYQFQVPIPGFSGQVVVVDWNK